MTSQVILHPTQPLMLLPDTVDAATVLSYVKPSKVVEGNGKLALAVAHNSDTVAGLRRLGITVPSSISTRYNWPGRFTPFDHQKTCAEFLTLHNKCANLSDMATGKTAAALWAADMLMREGLIRRVLIIAPLSTVEVVWVREMFTVVPHRTACLLATQERARRRRIAEETMDNFLITNHDGIQVIRDVIAKRGDIDLIIYDEADALKNGQTNRFKHMRTLLRDTGARLWLLTGTPTPQAPTDAWSLGRLINPKTTRNPTGVGTSFVRFRDSVMRQAGPFKWEARSNAAMVVRASLQPAIRFKKEDCIDLPPVVYMDRMTKMSPSQQRAFDQMKKDFQAQAITDKGEGVQVTAVNAAVKMSKLLQICSGAAYLEDGRHVEFDMPDRLAELEHLIESAAKKVLVFVPFRHAIDRIHAHLISKGITAECMHGGVKGSRRTDLLTRFMDTPNPHVLVAHPRTASHGLNFTCADTTIWFGPTFSAGGYQQANERMNRPGQDSHMAIVHLSSTEIERKAFQLLYDRTSSQQSLLSLYEETIGATP